MQIIREVREVRTYVFYNILYTNNSPEIIKQSDFYSICWRLLLNHTSEYSASFDKVEKPYWCFIVIIIIYLNTSASFPIANITQTIRND